MESQKRGDACVKRWARSDRTVQIENAKRTMGRIKLAEAEARLMKAEAKIHNRRTNVEAAKALLEAAKQEAKRLGAYCDVTPNVPA